ncbi:hypothetical protein [uncultured Christiangramia sp.]|uniref:hypothetical protein n=1 Tax=uncultured Christiangramia sp. TaxID=503836 RepID=UPI002605C837|nr:hypothetical protein [uncultured Christiangramia sp.]
MKVQEYFQPFSGSDVRTIYQLYLNGQVDDLKTFTAGVTTYFGTSYTMKINDTSTFLNFGSQTLNNQNDFDAFELLYQAWYNSYINDSGEVTAREKALLKILENSGISLFKANSTFSSGSELKFDTNNNIINTNCN